MSDHDLGGADAQPALVSDQAAARLAPSGFDQAQGWKLALSANEVRILRALNELPDDYGFCSFKSIAAQSGVASCDIRRVTRLLKRKGFTEFASGLWNDDGEPRGSGYSITAAGRLVCSLMEARP